MPRKKDKKNVANKFIWTGRIQVENISKGGGDFVVQDKNENKP